MSGHTDKAIENLVRLRGMEEKLSQLHVSDDKHEYGMDHGELANLANALKVYRERAEHIIQEGDKR